MTQNGENRRESARISAIQGPNGILRPVSYLSNIPAASDSVRDTATDGNGAKIGPKSDVLGEIGAAKQAKQS